MVLQFLKSGYQAVKNALKKSRSFFAQKLKFLRFDNHDELLEGLEELFYEADFGTKTTQELLTKTKSYLKTKSEKSHDAIISFLKNELLESLQQQNGTFLENKNGLQVVFVVGTNGNGKTTSCAKLANKLKQEGKSVLLAACDTFRAGAQEQLKIWAERIGIDLVSGTYTSDPAAVVFDAATSCIAKRTDVLIVDTAGRLENKTHLMKELEKISRTCKKIVPEAPFEVLLVLDATLGQNGFEQAKVFTSFIPLTGIILTKVDGTAKGGIAFSIQKELKVPIKFLTTGETINDIEVFEPESYVNALFDTSD